MKINIKQYINNKAGKRKENGNIFEQPIFDIDKVDSYLKVFDFDSNLNENNADFTIKRKSTHDGTLIFQHELFCNILDSIELETIKFLKPSEESKVLLEKIILGDIDLQSEFPGKVDLPIGRYPGQIDKMSLPVKIKVKNK